MEDVTHLVQTDSSPDHEDTTSVNRATARAERLNFQMLNIEVGEILESVRGAEITCTVTNQKPARVEYQGEEMSLSQAAQRVTNSTWGLQGSRYWMHGGRTLQEIREEIEDEETE